MLRQKPPHHQKVTTQNTSSKTSITQRLWTDSGRSVGVTSAAQPVWLNRFMGSQPSPIHISCGFRYGAFVISLWCLRYFVMAPSLWCLHHFVMVPSLFRYGAFVMSPRNNEKTKWHKSATIQCCHVLVLVIYILTFFIQYPASISACLIITISTCNCWCSLPSKKTKHYLLMWTRFNPWFSRGHIYIYLKKMAPFS